MIITNNEDILRVKCEEVLPEEVGSLIEILEKELDYSGKLGRPGIGLAAPQIGIAKKIAIVRLGNNINFNLVNATIKQGYHPSIFKDEGCLSFPGRVENTIRFQEVVIENNMFDPISFIATGLLAVVCQHELDHVNSTLFMDKVPIPVVKKNKVGPNDPCVCGKIDLVTKKIKKFKKCCGR